MKTVEDFIKNGDLDREEMFAYTRKFCLPKWTPGHDLLGGMELKKRRIARQMLEAGSEIQVQYIFLKRLFELKLTEVTFINPTSVEVNTCIRATLIKNGLYDFDKSRKEDTDAYN